MNQMLTSQFEHFLIVQLDLLFELLHKLFEK